MKKITTLACLLFLLWVPIATAQADKEITVAAAAGYRKMVTEIADLCQQTQPLKINLSFGNLGQIIAQSRTSGLISVIIGDLVFFERANLDLSETQLIGHGKLVLAWRKGIDISQVGDLADNSIKRIAIPHTQNAIFGIAAKQYLQHIDMEKVLEDKLIVVTGVPQVSSYLVTGEVDAGFPNLTDTLGIADRIGGYMVIEEGYNTIPIVAAFLAEHKNTTGVQELKNCLADPKIAEIAKKHGL